MNKARRLTSQLKRTRSSEKRKEIIENNRHLWKEIKDWLLSLSHGKCWYSEAKELCSFYDVDHFRPKNRAKDLEGNEREGYWWLAFDWKNYRISGNVCNRPNKDTCEVNRGKADYFPLRKNSPVVDSPSKNLMDEIICLLDPTDPNDPILLSFNENGSPVPSQRDKWTKERIEITVKLLHLDYEPLTEARRKTWLACRQKLSRIQKLLGELSRSSSISTKNEIKHLQEELREMVSSDAELAGTARACLLKSGIRWAQNIVASAK